MHFSNKDKGVNLDNIKSL